MSKNIDFSTIHMTLSLLNQNINNNNNKLNKLKYVFSTFPWGLTFHKYTNQNRM